MKNIQDIKGIYKRGEIYWLAFQRNGKRNYVSLQTTDLATAITSAAKIKRTEVITKAGKLSELINQFIAHKIATREYSRKSASWSESALLLFGAFAKNPATITQRHVTDWYVSLLKKVAPTSAQSYIRALRSFCS